MRSTPEELAKFTKSAQERITKLCKQRRNSPEKSSACERLSPARKAAEQVTKYLRNNDIGQDDFLLGLELMSAMRRGDFKKFYEGIQPYYRLAEEYLGLSLPQDLQARSSKGT